MGVLAQFARADISTEVAQASAPLSEGVPEVAVVRLQSLLNRNLSESEWQAVAEKLAEAQMAANEPEDTLVLLADARLRDLSWAKFWRAQALATLHRWTDALPLYQELANETSPFHKAAAFGAGETLRALGKRQQALVEFNLLVHDKEWGTRAQLRAAELFIELGNAPDAGRLLEQMQTVSIAERRERRVLRGRLELILHRPERAIGMFQAILKRQEGMPHSILITALFGIAEAHLQLSTPESGDDILERFIDQHYADPDLPLVFAKLDELYRVEHKPSRNELEKWVRRPEQPRRTFARWYLARLEIRAGRRERARQLFADLRSTGIKSPAVAPLFSSLQNSKSTTAILMKHSQSWTTRDCCDPSRRC
jgi:tetratricopeptide (TPR) repeat protein